MLRAFSSAVTNDSPHGTERMLRLWGSHSAVCQLLVILVLTLPGTRQEWPSSFHIPYLTAGEEHGSNSCATGKGNGRGISSGMEYRLHWWKGTAFRTFLHLPGHQSKQWLLCPFGNPTGLLAVSLPDHPLIGVQALSYRKLKITNNCFMTGLSFLVKVHSFINNLSSVSSLGNANIFLQAS